MQLLIVEDDLEASAAMAKSLSELGHTCLTAKDGEEGLRMARDGHFDVMIIDRVMPRMDGASMGECLRRDGDQTPVLFLSAMGETAHRVEGLNAGPDDYPVKPYALAEL